MNVTLGVVGAGRALELHVCALRRVSGMYVRLKRLVARRDSQVDLAKEKFGFEASSTNFADLLNDKEIDVIDICTPPYAHIDMIKKALNSGKHVICEKPLTGYFGHLTDEKPIGQRVNKTIMYDILCREIDDLREFIGTSKKKFMYAENFIYSPSIVRAGDIISEKKSRILLMKGEESLNGSSSDVAGQWSKTGGGTLIRNGTHPLSAILWLKNKEAIAHNKRISIKSILADTAKITTSLEKREHRYLYSNPFDVEDYGTMIISFSDETRAIITASDFLLGGSKNNIEMYCNDLVIKCKLTSTDMMKTYMLDEEGLDNIEFSEMLSSKIGWNRPFIEDEIIRGYQGEMQDFMECIVYDR